MYRYRNFNKKLLASVFYTRELTYHKNLFTVIALLKTLGYYITPIINRYYDSETINKNYKNVYNLKCWKYKD